MDDTSVVGSIAGVVRTLTEAFGSTPAATSQKPKQRSRTAQGSDMEGDDEIAAAVTEGLAAKASQQVPEEGGAMYQLLWGIQQQLVKLEQGQASLQSSVDGLASIPAAVTELQGRVSSVEGTLTTHSSELKRMQADLEAEAKARSSTNNDITALGKTLDQEMEAMNKQLVEQAKRLDDADKERARLDQLVADLSTNMAKLQTAEPATYAGAVGGEAGRGPAPPGPPGPHELLRHRLREEAFEYGRTLKLVGIVSMEQGGPGGREALARVKLCSEASKALSTLTGGVRITVEKAVWLHKEGQTPKLLVVLPTLDMAQAVRALKGPHGGPSKLASNQFIWPEYGPLEQAVRKALSKEQGTVPRSWLGRSSIMSKGDDGCVKVHPLSPQAIDAGLAAMHAAGQAAPRGRAPRGAQPMDA